MRPSVVLLNPPGSRVWLRDGYCSLEGRASTRFHPMDLLVQSGLLRNQARVRVVDAIGSGMGLEAALKAVRQAQPELILSLVGSVSADEDAAFLARLRDALPETTLVVSGDLVQFEPDGLDRFPAAHAALRDFTAPDLLAALDGGGASTWWRGRTPPAPVRSGSRFRYGLPMYEAFPESNYALPYRPGRIGSPLASFGCPFPCRFCNTSQVVWKVRELDDLLAELRWLADQGVRHAYIRDATFGVDRTQRAELIEALKALPRPLTWNSFTRVDLFEESDFSDLHAAGCRVLQLGLELPDEDALRGLHKPLRLDRVRSRIAAARTAGIAICGHFLLGLPGPGGPDLEQTVRYAVQVGCDYASFNVATPRPGAPFRHQGDFLVAAPARQLQGRAMRSFYTHPRTLLRQLRQLRRPADAMHLVRQATGLLTPRSTAEKSTAP